MVDRKPRPKTLAELRAAQQDAARPKPPAPKPTIQAKQLPTPDQTPRSPNAKLEEDASTAPRHVVRHRYVTNGFVFALLVLFVLVTGLLLTHDWSDRPGSDRSVGLPEVIVGPTGNVSIRMDETMRARVDRLALQCDRDPILIAVAISWNGAPQNAVEGLEICERTANSAAVRQRVNLWAETILEARNLVNQPMRPDLDFQAQLASRPIARNWASQLRLDRVRGEVRRLMLRAEPWHEQIATVCDVRVERVRAVAALRPISRDILDRQALCIDLRSDRRTLMDSSLIEQVVHREAMRFLVSINPSLTPQP